MTLQLLLDLIVRVTKITCGRTEGLTSTLPVTTLNKKKSCLKTEIGNKLIYLPVPLCLVTNEKQLQDILCSSPLDTLELSNQVYWLRSPDLRGIAKMGSYKGKVCRCRASKRNAFDESGVTPYISQGPSGLSALHIDLLYSTWGYPCCKVNTPSRQRQLQAESRPYDRQRRRV